jgi:hypothetical protein
LVAGGGMREHYNRQLEIYDPKTRRFSRAGKLYELHSELRMAPLLKDGRVIFAGGPGEHIELYNPKTQKTVISAKTLMNRGYHTVTVLHDGRVLIMGGMPKISNGWGFYGRSFDNAEIFDPKSEKITLTAKMTTRRGDHQAFLLEDGRVFITGGDPSPFGQTEFYDPKRKKFIPSKLHLVRRLGLGAQTDDKKVVILEGVSGMTKPPYPAEIIDPYRETLQKSKVFFENKHAPAIVSLSNGKVFVAGGSGANSTLGVYERMAQAEIFDSKNDKIINLPQMHEKRLFPTATRLLDGKVLVCGGHYSGHFNSSCELFIENN